MKMNRRPETSNTLRERERESSILAKGEKKSKHSKENNKNRKTLKIAIPLFVIAIALVLFVVLKQNTNLFNFIGETARQGVEEQADGGDDKQETQITEDDLEVGRNGYISSAQIIERATGTGPWDENDEPGNDSSPDNDIVRSFDQVTWTVNLTTALKEEVAQGSYTGGVVEFTVSLPNEYAKTEFAPYMEWDIDSMGWIEDASLSEDEITLTGKYSL